MYAEMAISCINDLLALMPEEQIREAQELRKARSPKAIVKREDVPFNVIAS